MMGLLHTEMAFLNVIGDWLENSGLTTMIQNTGVAKPGVAQSLLSGQSVVRTKYFHKFSVYTFHTLMPKAYNNSLPQHFPTSCHEMEALHPQLRYWSMALELELKLLSFLKPVRSGNFSMKKNALKQLLQWLFAHY